MGKRIEFEITPGACIGGAVMLLVLPLRWVFAAAVAAAVHESWHYLALRLCGGRVYRIRIGAGRTVMDTEPLQRFPELLCAAAGPLGSFSLLLAARFFPAAALCGLIHGVFNLLPVFPMDGGRILRCGLELAFPGAEGNVLRGIEGAVFCVVLCIGVCAVVRLRAWMLRLIFLTAVAANGIVRKIPCKESKLGVQ